MGAVDVMPLVYLDAHPAERRARRRWWSPTGSAELAVPVFLYGELAARRTRASCAAEVVAAALAQRIAEGELRPDFGPPRLHPTAGATLVAAREPLVAFNLELAPPATVEDARRIAALIREGGAEGLPGVRAIGVGLDGGCRTGVDERRAPAGGAAASWSRRCAHAQVAGGELVGLAPRAALEVFPEDVRCRGSTARR